MNTQLIKPADLSPTEVHHPDTVRKHKSDVADYYNAIRAIEQHKIIAAQAIAAQANAPLSDDAYFAMKVKQKKDSDDKQAARAAAEKAKELAAIDFAMSSPPLAEIMEHSEYRFLLSVINFSNRGYTLQDIHHMGMGLFHCTLNAPAPAKKTGSK